MKVIKQQLDRFGRKISKQSHLILNTERRSHNEKRVFIDQFTDKIENSVPTVSRQDIAIITTGFLSELRSIDKEIILKIIQGV